LAEVRPLLDPSKNYIAAAAPKSIGPRDAIKKSQKADGSGQPRDFFLFELVVIYRKGETWDNKLGKYYLSY
jgi:hypothetical protein